MKQLDDWTTYEQEYGLRIDRLFGLLTYYTAAPHLEGNGDVMDFMPFYSPAMGSWSGGKQAANVVKNLFIPENKPNT